MSLWSVWGLSQVWPDEILISGFKISVCCDPVLLISRDTSNISITGAAPPSEMETFWSISDQETAVRCNPRENIFISGNSSRGQFARLSWRRGSRDESLKGISVWNLLLNIHKIIRHCYNTNPQSSNNLQCTHCSGEDTNQNQSDLLRISPVNCPYLLQTSPQL